MFSILKNLISKGHKIIKGVHTTTDPIVEKSFILGTVVGIIKNRMLDISKDYNDWLLSYGNSKTYLRTTAYQVFRARLTELQLILDIIRKV